MNILDEQLVGSLTVAQVLAIVAPLALIQLGLIIGALVDLKRRSATELAGGKVLWAIILAACFFSFPLGLLGPVFYFSIGRKKAA